MEPLMKSDVFFFISSVGFAILTILASIFLVYLILIAQRVLEISLKVKENVDQIGKIITDVSLKISDKVAEVGEAVTEAKDFISRGGMINWIQYLIGSSVKKKRKKEE